MTTPRSPHFWRQARARFEQRGDGGLSLIEVLLASSLMVVVMTLTFLSLNTFISIGNTVNAQYKEYDQLVPSVAALQQLVRTEIEPGPADASGAVIPGFGVSSTTDATACPTVSGQPDQICGVGNFNLTFYANVGDTNGPAMIVAGETTASGTPTTTCSTTSSCNFQVKEYLPKAGTCPFSLTSTSHCTYTSSYKPIENVLSVVNDPSQTTAVTVNGTTVQAPTQPIFAYTLFDPGNDVTTGLSAADVQANELPLAATPYSPTYTGSSPAQTNPTTTAAVAHLNWCAATSATYPYLALSCPADTIQRVTIDLKVLQKGSGTNGEAEVLTTVYRNQGNSQAPQLPFQYSTNVG